nr:MAG TPA: hypothetical protein [Caudoviricetes sp.]
MPMITYNNNAKIYRKNNTSKHITKRLRTS